MDDVCCGGYCNGVCNKCRAAKKVALGALVLLNIYIWPKWVNGWVGEKSWLAFFAVLIILVGLLKFIMPTCPHYKGGAAPAKKGK